MKKILSTVLAVLTGVGCLFMGTGCLPKDEIVRDEKTVNLRLYKAGFGDAFIYELKEKFEAAYASEGYILNVLKPQYTYAGTPMVQEMAEGYDRKGIDLYVTGAIMPNEVSPIGMYANGNELCEDLEDLVFNQTAINYDGTESANKISERLSSDYVPFLRADNGKMYGFTWAQTSAGLVVNTKKLEAYGITEMPRTTNELFAIFETVLNGIDGVIEGSAKTKTYPLTYNLNADQGGATTYNTCAYEQWLAQYDLQAFNEFNRMQTMDENGEWQDMTEGWRVFENENIKPVLETSFQFMDKKYAAPGSGDTTKKLDQIQSLVMKDVLNKKGNPQVNAIFMLNGDWFLNEVKSSYGDYLNDIAFINVPVISSLGVEIFSKYGLSDAECDEVLSYVCKQVDENKTVDEIVELLKTEKQLTADKADVQRVATARGLCFARGIEHLAFIPKGCTKKDIAAKVLRMMASDDFANTFMRASNAFSPYTKGVDIKGLYPFVDQAKALTDNIHFRAFAGRIQGIRRSVMRTDYMFPGARNMAYDLYSRADNLSYAEAAQKMYSESLTTVQGYWDDYISNKE